MTRTIEGVLADSDAAVLRAVRLFLLLLLCGDLVYMAIHIGHLTVPALRGEHYSLETDGGLAEFYQYVKQLWLAACLAIAFVRMRHPVLLIWSAFFGFLMLDDALELHETIGLSLGQRLGLPAVGRLRPDDLGEIVVAAVVGSVLLLGLAVAWWRDRAATLRLSRELLMLTAALAFCGVVLDTLHVVAWFGGSSMATPLAFLEDGGEMVIVSVLTASALDLAVRSAGAPGGLWRLLRGASGAARADAGLAS